jgi:hypothetical protein
LKKYEQIVIIAPEVAIASALGGWD